MDELQFTKVPDKNKIFLQHWLESMFYGTLFSRLFFSLNMTTMIILEDDTDPHHDNDFIRRMLKSKPTSES